MGDGTMRALPAPGPLLARAALTLARRPGAHPALAVAPASFVAPPLAPAWLAAYHAFFGGFRAAVPLPALYPLAQRAQLATMVARGFPYPVVGMVHLANAQRLRRPLDPAAGFTLEVVAAPAEWPGAPMWDCVAFDVAYLQAGREVATCRSTYLARRRGRRSGERPVEAEEPAEDPLLAATLAFPADEGRRYAALSGDHNPIHLHPALSRWFGFPRPILHGMDGLARAAAAIERALDAPLGALDATFEKAVPLPATAALAGWRTGPGTGAFRLTSPDGSARHVAGAFAI